MENCKVLIQKRWSRSLKLGAGYTLYPTCLRKKKGQTNIEQKMYQSSRLNDAKRLFQGIKSVSFFHISAVHVRTGICAYIDGTHLLLLFKRYKVSIVEIHVDSVDNLPGKKKQCFGKTN